MQPERDKQKDKSKKQKGRAVGKIGGRKRAVPGRERAANEKGREEASSATNRRKQKVKRRSLGIKIDFLRFFTARLFTFEYTRSRGVLRASGN